MLKQDLEAAQSRSRDKSLLAGDFQRRTHVSARLDHRLDTYLATEPLSQLLCMQIMCVCVCLPSLEGKKKK